MSDQSRLLESGEDELAVMLLRAGASEEPSEASLRRTAAALGVSSALAGALGVSALNASSGAATAVPKAMSLATSAGGAATAPASVGAAIVLKPLIIGVFGGLFAMGGLSYVKSGEAPSASAARAALSDARPARVARQPALGRATDIGSREAVEEPSEASASDERALPHTEARRSALQKAFPTLREVPSQAPTAPAPTELEAAAPPPSAVPRSPTPNRTLARELALLEQARQALRAGNAVRARATLDEYDHTRQSGVLDPEASMLRIRVLQELGDRASASQMARKFLQSHPERGQDTTLRAIANEAGPTR